MAMTTYGDISQRTAYWAATTMLAHAEPILVLQKLAQIRPIPKNEANQVKFRRPIPFSVTTTPLIEGVTPTAQKMRYEDVPVTLQQYGDLVEITDMVADTSEDPVLTDASMLSGEQAAETMEMLTYGAIKAGTNKFYTGADTARADVDVVMDLNDQHAVVRSLHNNRAKKHTRVLNGSVNINTTPIEAAFVAFCHTDLEHDIRAITGFVPVAEYGNRQPICPEELGSVENVRYVCSPLLTPYPGAGGAGAGVIQTGAAADVYPVIYTAMNSYGCVPLKGKEAITPTVINPNTPSKSDPLGQRGYVSWKTYFAAKVLNESWMGVLETAATAL